MITIYDQKSGSIDEKVKRLMEQHKSKCAENEILKNDLMLAHKNFVVLQEEYSQFRKATALSGESETAKAETKSRILKLLREIDKCLALLNE